jgi:hypothetical protein
MGLMDISYGPFGHPSYGPFGHLSQCPSRLWHMPGGYFSGANFRELVIAEVQRRRITTRKVNDVCLHP